MPDRDDASDAGLEAAQMIITGAMRKPLTDDEILRALQTTIEIVAGVRPQLRDRIKAVLAVLTKVI